MNVNPPDDYSLLLEDKFVRLVEETSGIVFDAVKRRELKGNLVICMEEMRELSFSRYYERLSGGDEDHLKKLINFITINETYFFRVPEHFDILESTVLPRMFQQKKKGGPIAVWSAGCSSGEEVYSIIIKLLEFTGLKEMYRPMVLGTDINEEMLYLAEKGIYSGRTIKTVPSYLLDRYFEPFRDRFRVRDSVKEYVDFSYLNLAGSYTLDPFPRPDIIFFRNVLIYFNRDTTRRIIESFYHLLNDGGYLILGPSETLWDISDKFELMMFDRAYIYQRARQAQPAFTKPAAPARPRIQSDSGRERARTRIVSEMQPVRPEPPAPTHPPTLSVSEAQPVSEVRPASPEQPPPVADVADDIFPSIEDKLRILQEEATLMIELGDYQKAETVLDEVASAEKHSKPVILLKMTLLVNQDRGDELEGLMREALEIHPIFPEAHYLKGRYLEAAHREKEAAAEYRKVLFIDPDYLLARERLLKILLASRDIKNAQREARNILEQLAAGHVKNFRHSVGETIEPTQLKLFSQKVLT